MIESESSGDTTGRRMFLFFHMMLHIVLCIICSTQECCCIVSISVLIFTTAYGTTTAATTTTQTTTTTTTTTTTRTDHKGSLHFLSISLPSLLLLHLEYSFHLLPPLSLSLFHALTHTVASPHGSSLRAGGRSRQTSL